MGKGGKREKKETKYFDLAPEALGDQTEPEESFEFAGQLAATACRNDEGKRTRSRTRSGTAYGQARRTAELIL